MSSGSYFLFIQPVSSQVVITFYMSEYKHEKERETERERERERERQRERDSD